MIVHMILIFIHATLVKLTLRSFKLLVSLVTTVNRSFYILTLQLSESRLVSTLHNSFIYCYWVLSTDSTNRLTQVNAIVVNLLIHWPRNPQLFRIFDFRNISWNKLNNIPCFLEIKCHHTVSNGHCFNLKYQWILLLDGSNLKFFNILLVIAFSKTLI